MNNEISMADAAAEGTQEAIFEAPASTYVDGLTDPELVELCDAPLADRADKLEDIHRELRDRLVNS